MSLNYFDLNSVTIESRFAPWTHGHSIDAITGLRAELDATQSGLSSTSEIQFKTAEVFGNITPNSSAQYDLGSTDKHFKTAWIDELHLSENTLYLGDTPVIGTDASTVHIKADTDQGITVKTTGTGESKIISENGIEISNSGMNGQIAIQATGAGGSVSFGATSVINFTAPDANFSGDVEVTGHTVFNTATFTNDVVFQGDNIQMDTTNFTAEDNRITLNSGEMGDGVTAVYSGFDIDRGNLVNWQFVFNEATDTFEYGPIGGTANIVVSKAYVDGVDALKLNSALYTAADVFSKVKSLDGSGSGLDADLLDGHEATFFIKSAQDYMDSIQSIDGTGSGLDADLLDGLHASHFAVDASTYNKTEVDTIAATKLNSSIYTAADVFSKVKSLDGAGSGLDADLLDGHSSSYYSIGTHNHDTAYLGLSAKAADANKLDGHDSTYFAVAGSTDSSSEVDAKIAALVDSSPAALDTLNELAAALGDDPNFATTVNNNIATKLDSSAYTAADVLAKIKTVDGSGSGLDADMLDGHSASYFLNSTSNAASATKLATARTIDIVGDITANAVAFDGTANIAINVQVNNDSHTHSSSTLGASLVPANAPALGTVDLNTKTTAGFWYQSANANTSSARHYPVNEAGALTVMKSAGVIQTYITYGTSAKMYYRGQYSGTWGSWVRCDNNGISSNSSLLGGHSASYFSPSTHTHSSSYLGLTAKAADSNLLDGLDSSAFLRSNASDVHSGDLRPSSNNARYLGTSSYRYKGVYAYTFYGNATSANYADLAERYTVAGSPVPGQVILIGGKDTDCVISDEISSQAVLGVVSTQPGLMMNSELENGTFIALKGRVPCQVFGKVKKGEPLVSYKNGMAISINHEFVVNQEKQGIIFGKSLESSDEIGVSTIEIVVL